MKRTAVVPDVDMIFALFGMSWISDGSTASATRSKSLPSCWARKLQQNTCTRRHYKNSSDTWTPRCSVTC